MDTEKNYQTWNQFAFKIPWDKTIKILVFYSSRVFLVLNFELTMIDYD